MTSPSVQLRRKPRQSRAKQTQQALLDGVVRLLQQQSPAQLTIREIPNWPGSVWAPFMNTLPRKKICWPG
ncbi:hypothetical protein AB2762_02720 [Acinetobacter indicus]